MGQHGRFVKLLLLTLAVLTWSRSPELDIDHYNIYTCLNKGCTVQKIESRRSDTAILQTPVGTNPTVTQNVLPGNLAITAVDRSGNESGLSNVVAYPPGVAPGVAPSTAQGLTIR